MRTSGAAARLDEIVRDPEYAGLHWSIDPETPADARASAHVTAAEVARYLREHKQKPKAFEVLAYDPARCLVYVRWPNGSIAWESIVSLHARGFTVPTVGVLESRLA